MDPKNDELSHKGGFLSDTEIRARLANPQNGLQIEPLLDQESQITGVKVDMHLSGIFYEVRRSTLTAYDPLTWKTAYEYRRKLMLPIGEPYTLHPGSFVLAPTFEHVAMPNDLMAILEGRSSLGRLGVIIHATACIIDPGYNGAITLEISNLGQLPVNLYAFSRVASLSFCTVLGKVKRWYGQEIPYPQPMSEVKAYFRQKYDSMVSQPSKFHEDWEHELLRFSKVRRKKEKEAGGKQASEILKVKE